MKKNISKILAIFIFVISLILLCNKLSADTLSDYQNQMNSIKKQQQDTTSKLQGVEKEISQTTYDIMSLDENITTSSIQLDQLQSKIDTVNQKIDEQTKVLQESSQQFNSAQDLYTTRLRVIYENGIPSVLDVLFSAKSISDFFSKLNVIDSLLDYDKTLTSNMESQKEYIDYIKKDMEVQKVQLDQLMYDKQKSAQALDDARDAKQQKMNDLQNNKTSLQATAQELNNQEQQASQSIQNEIERLEKEAEAKAAAEAAKNGSSGGSSSNLTFAGGQFAWPVPGYTLITTFYNELYDPWNTGKGTRHTGTDISGANIFGKPIVAMQSGTVLIASYGWNGGYGNYVVINHGKSATDGNTYKTLYGHATSLAVSAGQTVTKGQVIAYVGSTGNSTGAHCHVEIWQNNVRGAILDYFKGMTITYHGRTYQYE